MHGARMEQCTLLGAEFAYVHWCQARIVPLRAEGNHFHNKTVIASNYLSFCEP